MCISKKELEEKVQELRSLKTLKEETEDGIKAIEREIISYMKENETDTEITDTAKIQKDVEMIRKKNPKAAIVTTPLAELHLTKKSSRKSWGMT